MADLERAKIKVGFIPIIDCAAIVLAEELGAYERQGLEVEIRREVSWANVRDKLALGVLDASHILAPLPLAITLGIDSVSVPLVNVMTLQVNGNALTLSLSRRGVPLRSTVNSTSGSGAGRVGLPMKLLSSILATSRATSRKANALAGQRKDRQNAAPACRHGTSGPAAMSARRATNSGPAARS